MLQSGVLAGPAVTHGRGASAATTHMHACGFRRSIARPSGMARPSAASRRSGDWSGQDGRAASTSGRPPAAPGLMSELMYTDGDFVDLGYIKAAHGVRGEVKVEVITDSPKERFGKRGATLYLRPPQPKGIRNSAAPERLIELTTAGYRVQVQAAGKEVYLLKFKEVGDRDAAEALRGFMVVLPLAMRAPLRAPDEYYVQDLVGCHVFMQSDGAYVGRVVDLLSGFGTHDTLQLNLRPTRGDLDAATVRTCFVPFAKEIVPLVDKRAKRILMAPPEGLLDLSTTKKAKKLDEGAKLAKLEEDAQREHDERARRAADDASSPDTAAGASHAGTSTADDDRAAAAVGDSDEADDEEQGARVGGAVRRPRRLPPGSGGRRPSARKLRMRSRS